MFRENLARVVSLVGLLSGIAAQSALGGEGAAPLSPRNADYSIDVRLDTAERSISARQTVRWRNTQASPTDELWFHLYWNAWRNDRSTWMIEDTLRGRDRAGGNVPADGWSWIEVDSIRLVAEPPLDLTPTRRFASPDDGNPHDRTVMVVTLPQPVMPGEVVELELDWRATVPRTVARTGFRGDFYFVAHWFPQLGVYEADGWNCRQFHASTEFFADYGVYRVTLTVPRGWTVGATGSETDRVDNPDGTTTHAYEQADVHGFAWTTSPDYREATTRFEHPSLPPVELRLLYQPDHAHLVERHFEATRVALELFGDWYGPYPYGHLTIVDPAFMGGADGMEYPTLFVAGTTILAPPEADDPESVTIHETAHQFWYGVVGTNEFDHAWLDEGLATYSTLRALDERYPPARVVRRFLSPPGRSGSSDAFFPWVFHDIEKPRWLRRLDRYRGGATSDVPATPSWAYWPASGRALTYDHAMLWLLTLERHLGEPTLRAILAAFYERYAFAHPAPEDFFAVAEEVAGRDLGWYFDQVHGSATTFDYAIVRLTTVPAEPQGWVDRGGELLRVERGTPQDEALQRSEVVVERVGSGVFPVEVQVEFDDGAVERLSWDGRAKREIFVFERAAKVVRAEVDPERVLMLDLQPSNNTRVATSEPLLPAVKWSAKWVVWMQDLLAAFAYFS